LSVQHQGEHIIIYFFHLERKGFFLETLTTSYFMLQAKHVDSKTTIASSFIRLSKEVVVSISSLDFRFMDMAKFNLSFDK
jgi:hypothetical protein